MGGREQASKQEDWRMVTRDVVAVAENGFGESKNKTSIIYVKPASPVSLSSKG